MEQALAAIAILWWLSRLGWFTPGGGTDAPPSDKGTSSVNKRDPALDPKAESRKFVVTGIDSGSKLQKALDTADIDGTVVGWNKVIDGFWVELPPGVDKAATKARIEVFAVVTDDDGTGVFAIPPEYA